MQKRDILLMAIALLTVLLCACGDSQTASDRPTVTQAQLTTAPATDPTTEPVTEPTTIAPTEPAPEKVNLSETCDEVLGTCDIKTNYGTNKYTIVANYTEDYMGLKIEVGVIKNNKWVLEPTVDMPFVTKKLHKDDVPSVGDIWYMGQGCFVSTKEGTSYDAIHTFYNVETGESYSTADDEDRISYLGFIRSDSDDQTIIRYDLYKDYTEFITLNKRDMTLGKITIPSNGRDTLFLGGNIASDVFAVKEGTSRYPNYYFYDISGNLVLDLSEYKTPSQSPFFKKWNCCELDVVNNNGTEYTITLDREGNVLSSTEKKDD